MAGILFIISAPSGSGKSTLVAEVRRLVEGLEFSVSYTTESRGAPKKPGASITSPPVNISWRWWSTESSWSGPRSSATTTERRWRLEHARRAGKDLLLDIDVQGAVQVINDPEGGIDFRRAAEPGGAGATAA